MVMQDAGLLLARGGETVSQQVAGHETPAAEGITVSRGQTICERRRALVASAGETLIGIAVDVIAERRRSGETHGESVDAVRVEVRRICSAIEHRVIEYVLSITDVDAEADSVLDRSDGA
jgi:ribosomal protein L13E